MIDEMMRGPASSIASHWAVKSGVAASPASGCHPRAPMPEKFAYPRFVYRIARRWWVGYPIIELKTAIATGPHIARPDPDLVGLHQQHAASTEPASISNRNR